jgi:hypothetical protein
MNSNCDRSVSRNLYQHISKVVVPQGFKAAHRNMAMEDLPWHVSARKMFDCRRVTCAFPEVPGQSYSGCWMSI